LAISSIFLIMGTSSLPRADTDRTCRRETIRKWHFPAGLWSGKHTKEASEYTTLVLGPSGKKRK
jgi:hypothetical protein